MTGIKSLAWCLPTVFDSYIRRLKCAISALEMPCAAKGFNREPPSPAPEASLCRVTVNWPIVGKPKRHDAIRRVSRAN